SCLKCGTVALYYLRMLSKKTEDLFPQSGRTAVPSNLFLLFTRQALHRCFIDTFSRSVPPVENARVMLFLRVDRVDGYRNRQALAQKNVLLIVPGALIPKFSSLC
ncbi:MAG: hypothetical protein D3916_15330, partial [Candidatus Electrothrix sp. MAN1_4]|nr:hypothetical protein [Candidatus Electrothrix sp. MAN1_4]